MSVRHVHARPGEYIAVHRQHGSRGGGSGSGGGDGCLTLLAIIFVIWIVASLWEIFVTLAIICAAGWLTWTFRRPLWAFLCWICAKLSLLLRAGCKGIQAWYSQKKLSQTNGAMNGNCVSDQSDYEKIRQHRQ